MSPKQLTKQIIGNYIKSILIGILGLVAVIVIAKSITKKTEDLRQKIVVSKLAADRVANAETLKAKIAPLGDIDAQIESAFPTADNILDFVSAMDSIAGQSGLQSKLHFEQPQALPSAGILNLSSIDYTATLNGSENSMAPYLANFERLPFFTQISAISIDSHSGTDFAATMTFKGKLFIRDN